MDIQILGPFNASVSGGSVVPTASKPRQILALLALNSGRIVPVSTLMEEVWGTALPKSALTTLQTYILQLRRRLGTALGPDGPSAKEILTTRNGGYLLHLRQQDVDVYRYERLVAGGQRAFDAGDDKSAAQQFREALAMWRGPALVDVQVGPILEIEAMRLHESRLGVVERRIDADLRLGRHAELLAELTELTARHPQHEGLHAQAMLALYRSGRQSAALDVYRQLRIRLSEDLGIDPSPQLQRMYQGILTVDPALNRSAEARAGSVFDLFAA